MDLDGSIFWWFGGALVLAALALSFVGIRGKGSFPGSGPLMTGVTVVFAVVVIGTAAYAVANAREEQEHRDEELAHEAEEAAEEAGALEQEGADEGASSEAQQGEEEGAAGAGEGEGPSGGAEEILDVTSPADGGLSFEPAGLEASAGTITLAYENPSQVPHSIAIEDEAGEILAESEVVTASETEAGAELAPGEFAFFCTVPGHRQGGMEGTLTVNP